MLKSLTCSLLGDRHGHIEAEAVSIEDLVRCRDICDLVKVQLEDALFVALEVDSFVLV